MLVECWFENDKELKTDNKRTHELTDEELVNSIRAFGIF